MTGMRRYDISIGVSMFPHRKKPCLYVQKDNRAYMLGQFKNTEDADLFFAALDYVTFGNDEDKVRRLLQEMEDNNADND